MQCNDNGNNGGLAALGYSAAASGGVMSAWLA
jgi:hypothetical protein